MSKAIFIPSFPITFPLLRPCTLDVPKQCSISPFLQLLAPQ